MAAPTFVQIARATAPPAAVPATTAAPAATPEKTIEVNRAAKVVLVKGDVAAYSPTKRKRALAVGGYMSVRPNTKMRFVKYQAKGEDTDTAVFGLLQGSLRSVTGWIGKFNRAKYTVLTPTATARREEIKQKLPATKTGAQTERAQRQQA